MIILWISGPVALSFDVQFCQSFHSLRYFLSMCAPSISLGGVVRKCRFCSVARNIICCVLTGLCADDWWPGTIRRALRTGTFKMSVDVKLTLQFTSGWRPFLRQQVVNIHIDWNTRLSINGYTHIIRCVNKTALLMLASSECYGGVFLFCFCLMDILWLFRSHFVFCNVRWLKFLTS